MQNGKYNLKSNKLLSLLAVLLVFPSVLFATTLPPDTVMVAGKQYDKGWLHTFLFGKHYRKVWAQPVRAPYLNLQKEAGGLKPVKRGGSYQTKNLRMVNPEGKEYVIRSIDKDPSQAISPKLKHSFVGSLMRDQTSVVHPYAAFIVPPLANAAGILHTVPKLYVVPNDPALGEFRNEFKNMLVLLEERPEGNRSDSPNLGYSEDIVSSKVMFNQLVASSKNRVDARAFLRARLFDMWIGDWSRREDQWRWASYKKADGGLKFKPIPRDRDHAFFKFNDGLVTAIASAFIPYFRSFGYKIKHLKGLNKSGHPLDKSLLIFLSEEDFIQIGDSLKMQLTDQVIENAVRSWPENIYALNGKEFESKLKCRRNQLPEVAQKFYRKLAKKVEVPGSDEPELFRLTGQQNALKLEMFRPGENGNSDSLIVSRTFKKSATKQLKIYGLGGIDRFEITGEGNPLKKVRLYDGEGNDSVSISSVKKKKIRVMDSHDGNAIQKSKKLKIIKYQPKANEFDGAGWLLRHRLDGTTNTFTTQ